MVLTAKERKLEDDNEIVNQAKLMEELGRTKGYYRPICIRARYASTDTSIQSQPWTIFSNADTLKASEITKVILKYCADNLKQTDNLYNCVIN